MSKKSKPKLRYAITSEPFPLQASPAKGNLNHAALTVVASNPADGVKLYGLSIKIPIGDTSTDLTNAKPTAIAPHGWALYDTKPKTGSVEYIFRPSGSGKKKPKPYKLKGEGLAFRIENVAVNRQPGTAQIKITEGSARKKKKSPIIKLPVSKFPPDWGTIDFWADTPSIKFDGQAKLQWAGPAQQGDGPEATYTLQYETPDAGLVTIPKKGEPALGASGTYPSAGQSLKLERTTTFTLNVSATKANQQYQAQKQVAIDVEPPTPSVTISSNPASETAILPNTLVEISWTVIGADKLVLKGSNGSSKTFTAKADFPQGSTTVRPQKPTTYQMTAYKQGKQAATSAPITANVQPVKIDYFYAAPIPSHADMPVKLRWSVTNTTAVNIAVGSEKRPSYTNLPPAGVIEINPSAKPQQVTLTTVGYKPQSKTLSIQSSYQIVDLKMDLPSDAPLAAAPDGKHLYSFSSVGGALSLITVNIEKKNSSSTVVQGQGGDGFSPDKLIVSPDGKTVYAIGRAMNMIPQGMYGQCISLKWDEKGKGEAKIIAFNGDRGALGLFSDVAVAPDGETIYLGQSERYEENVGIVSLYDTATGQFVREGIRIPPLDGRSRLFSDKLALSPDGKTLFVLSRDAQAISVIDTSSRTVQKSLLLERTPVVQTPIEMAISPNGEMLFVGTKGNDGPYTCGLVEFDIAKDFRVQSPPLSDFLGSPITQMVVGEDSASLYMTDGYTFLIYYPQRSGEDKFQTIKPGDAGISSEQPLLLAPDGKCIYFVGSDGVTLQKMTLPEPYLRVQAALYVSSQQLYLFSGSEYTRYLWQNGRFSDYERYPKWNVAEWKNSFAHVDAAFYASGNAYFFSHEQYIRFGDPNDSGSDESPKWINETTWPGLPFKRITAAFAVDINKIYLFSQQQFCIYDLGNKKLLQEPKLVDPKSWPGLPFQQIDAAFINEQKEITFFSGLQSAVYDLDQKRLVSEWPQPINPDTWPSLPPAAGALKELYLLPIDHSTMNFSGYVSDSDLLGQVKGLTKTLDNPFWWAKAFNRWAFNKYRAVAIPTWEKGAGGHSRSAYLLSIDKLGIGFVNAPDAELKEVFANPSTVDLNDFLTWNEAAMRWARVKHQAIGFPNLETGDGVRGVFYLPLSRVSGRETAVSNAELNATVNKAYSYPTDSTHHMDNPLNWGWGMWIWGQQFKELTIPTWGRVWD
ncbi:MAG: hypothetical protein AAF614_14585 [Chloroflexota bacterium]